MDNIIKELKLQLGEKEISLTVEEAKKLKEALDELFVKEIIEVRPFYPYWYWQPLTPYWVTWQQGTGPYRIMTSGASSASYDSGTSAMTFKVA